MSNTRIEPIGRDVPTEAVEATIANLFDDSYGKAKTAIDAAAVSLQSSAVCRISDSIARVEIAVAGLCVGVVFALLVLNIVTRSAGNALYWVDEAAITAMVWMAFFAASFTLHKRGNIAVTSVADLCPLPVRRALAVIVDLVLLSFVLVLATLVWRWFAPLEFFVARGDPAAFALATGNFIYEEPTQTLGFHKAWMWLIIPVFTACSLVHCIANLSDSLRALGHPRD